jgi:hypothetical protein
MSSRPAMIVVDVGYPALSQKAQRLTGRQRALEPMLLNEPLSAERRGSLA